MMPLLAKKSTGLSLLFVNIIIVVGAFQRESLVHEKMKESVKRAQGQFQVCILDRIICFSYVQIFMHNLPLFNRK